MDDKKKEPGRRQSAADNSEHKRELLDILASELPPVIARKDVERFLRGLVTRKTLANADTEVRDFLRKWQVIGQDKEAVVVVDGITYLINNIGLRMLRPRELFTANGFPASYVIDPVCNGKPLSITSQVKKCGNSVPPEFAHAIIAANHYPPSDKERVSIFGMEATA